MEFLFPETTFLQMLMKNVCKAAFVSQQCRRFFLYFGLKHTLDVQVARADILLEGHPPVRGISCNPGDFS